jgi:hypothetical protein
MLLMLLVATACAGSGRPELRAPTSHAARASSSNACVRPTLGPDSPYRLPLAGPVTDPVRLRLLADVPAEVRRTVVATGLEPLLADTLEEQAQHGDTPTLAGLSHRQEMAARLGSFDSQLASVLFEVDCTGDTLEDLVHEFDRREHARELKLTIASLVVGAVSGVVAGIWELQDREGKGAPITAATGAGATAALGVAAFIPHSRPVAFSHPRNLLAPIAHGDDPAHIYPSFVFRLLTLPMSDGAPTPAAELIQRWRAALRDSLPAEQHERAEQLLFGEGGVYPANVLTLRQTMLDQLESRIGALSRELEVLERYLTRITARSAIPASPHPPLSH